MIPPQQKTQNRTERATHVDRARATRVQKRRSPGKATDLSGATFSAALDEVLEKNPEGVRTADLEQILNEYWKKMQRSHPKMNKVVYRCDVDLMGIMSPCFRASERSNIFLALFSRICWRVPERSC